MPHRSSAMSLILHTSYGPNLLEHVTDMEKIMAYGVMSMPALVVNEKVMSMGKVLKAAEVEKLLRG